MAEKCFPICDDDLQEHFRHPYLLTPLLVAKCLLIDKMRRHFAVVQYNITY